MEVYVLCRVRSTCRKVKTQSIVDDEASEPNDKGQRYCTDEERSVGMYGEIRRCFLVAMRQGRRHVLRQLPKAR